MRNLSKWQNPKWRKLAKQVTERWEDYLRSGQDKPTHDCPFCAELDNPTGYRRIICRNCPAYAVLGGWCLDRSTSLRNICWGSPTSKDAQRVLQTAKRIEKLLQKGEIH